METAASSSSSSLAFLSTKSAGHAGASPPCTAAYVKNSFARRNGGFPHSAWNATHPSAQWSSANGLGAGRLRSSARPFSSPPGSPRTSGGT